MLFNSKVIALVGNGDDLHWPKSKVVLWDYENSIILGSLNFKSEIKAVKLRQDRYRSHKI
jgi:hypothetical protein